MMTTLFITLYTLNKNKQSFEWVKLENFERCEMNGNKESTSRIKIDKTAQNIETGAWTKELTVFYILFGSTCWYRSTKLDELSVIEWHFNIVQNTQRKISFKKEMTKVTSTESDG